MRKPFRKIRHQVLRLKRYVTSIKEYQIQELTDDIGEYIKKGYRTLIPLLVLAAFSAMIYDVGFNTFYSHNTTLYWAWRSFLYVLQILLFIRFVVRFRRVQKWRSRLFNFFLIILIFAAGFSIVRLLNIDPSSAANEFLFHKLVVYFTTIFLFLEEGSHVLRLIYRKSINPALLFVVSFFLMIGAGTLLLMLPNATTNGISPIDAWFTSASAVCVTGLTVVDTATHFSLFGKIIILMLIQLGGLGIMTFAGLLAYLASGTASFSSQLALKDMMSTNRLSNVFGLILRVFVVTLFFEAFGALLIYSSLDPGFLGGPIDRLFFSVFHAVSAFCNAGFSTLTNNLYEADVRHNYELHLIIAALIILGGLGFPIVFNIFTFIRIKVMNFSYRLLRIPRRETYVHILHISSRLALTTTLVLLVFGFITYFIFEQDATLKDHPTTLGKIVTSFFGSVTPRTAGFNTVNLTAFTLPTVMIYLLLMWIGASPGSTGGGIKTTVAAVALLNLRSIITGKPRTEAFRTQVSEDSINRAFAIMLLSLLVLGISVLLISMQDSDKGLLKIAFEVFSAFSTVGLTLGITPDLSVFSKLVITIVMFIGRVGTLTLLFAIVKPAKPLYYRYPVEEVHL